MDRRAFLRNAALVAAGTVAVDQLDVIERIGWARRLFAGFGAGIPTIYGDGLHDDTRGLQALFDGKRVRDPQGLTLRSVNDLTIRGGTFVITDTLYVQDRPGQTILIADCHINAVRVPNDRPWMSVQGPGALANNSRLVS